MALLVAVILALFVLPSPWGYALVAAAAVYEGVTTWLGWRWSRTRRKVVGPAALVGATGEVVDACRPDGWVKVRAELWQARCDEGADAGSDVRIRSIEGLVLVVEPLPRGPGP